MFVSITTARGHTARLIVLYAKTQLYRHSFFPALAHAGCDNNGPKKICTGAGLKV
jgi:hypothetical protein